METVPQSTWTGLGGREFFAALAALPAAAREAAVLDALAQGATPPGLGAFVPVDLAANGHTARVLVAPDYLAVGTDADYLYVPLTPGAAQRVADARNALLPTRRLVDAIWAAATAKLTPHPQTPHAGEGVESLALWARIQDAIDAERAAKAYALGSLTAGHKKDVVVSRHTPAGHVAIYGWFHADGTPIQPLFTGHGGFYADYSHGIRLVSRDAIVDGAPMDLAGVLADPDLAPLVSDEGPLAKPGY